MPLQFDTTMSANLVMMMRADVDGAIWLVDDEDESRFYEQLAHSQSRVIPSFGAALDVLEAVTRRGAGGVVVVRKRVEPLTVGESVFVPDLGDAASILLASKSTDRVLGEIGGAYWLTACARDFGGLLPWAVQLARQLAILRREYPIEHLPELSEQLDNFVDWSSMELKWSQLASAQTGAGFSEVLLHEAKSVPRECELPVGLHSCDGHDVVSALAAATRMCKPRGLSAYTSVSTTQLLSMLRSAFDHESFESDNVFWRLKRWQWHRRRYALFRPWRQLEPFGILLNQRYIEGDVANVIALASADEPVTLFQLDLDNFKNVNDTLGHIEGDDALRLYQAVIAEALKGRGEAYRRGGDEVFGFVVGISRDAALTFAETVRAEIEGRFRDWSKPRDLAPGPTASIGVVHVTEPVQVESLMRVLEHAQLNAKRGGKNKVVCGSLAPPPSR